MYDAIMCMQNFHEFSHCGEKMITDEAITGGCWKRNWETNEVLQVSPNLNTWPKESAPVCCPGTGQADLRPDDSGCG